MSTGGIMPRPAVPTAIDLPALLAEKPSRRKRYRIRSTEPSLAGERGYVAALRRLLKAAWGIVEADVLPAVARAVARRDGFVTDDPGVDAAMAKLERELGRRLTRTAVAMVQRVLVLERRRNTRQFIAAVKAAIGIDLASVITESGLTEVFEDILKRNADLITKLSEATRDKIRMAVEEAVINGTAAATLRKTLRDEFGLLDNRAKLIARDQIAKANSQLNKARQQQAGVEEYEWSSSRDERVRPLHRELNGRKFRWDQPGPDGGMHPGEPINCRCVAIAVINL